MCETHVIFTALHLPAAVIFMTYTIPNIIFRRYAFKAMSLLLTVGAETNLIILY